MAHLKKFEEYSAYSILGGSPYGNIEMIENIIKPELGDDIVVLPMFNGEASSFKGYTAENNNKIYNFLINLIKNRKGRRLYKTIQGEATLIKFPYPGISDIIKASVLVNGGIWGIIYISKYNYDKIKKITNL